MEYKKGLVLALLLLASLVSRADVEATKGALISSTILPLELPLQEETEFLDVLPVGRLTSLRDAILLYESIQHSGLWRPIEDGPLLKFGDRNSQIPLLRGQLRLLGDLPSQSVYQQGSQYFDESLEAALMRFQQRHSLKTDGILGPDTRRALNVPPWQRIDQLVLNINRQQQLAKPAGGAYLQVNIPEFRLRLFVDQQVALEMKAIVGRITRQTPVFSSRLKSLVVNPDWNVPKSIAFKDILPRWMEDNNYLSENNLLVLSGWEEPVLIPETDIDLSRMYQGANYQRLWEPPGLTNTLGRVKFPLLSDNSIYLHDTNGHHLFEKEKRAFSSGCIRLEEARLLADALIQVVNYWDSELLDPLFEETDTYIVELEHPVPVYITYWTAWLDENGLLNFADDLYERDPVDFAELFGKTQELAVRSD